MKKFTLFVIYYIGPCLGSIVGGDLQYQPDLWMEWQDGEWGKAFLAGMNCFDGGRNDYIGMPALVVRVLQFQIPPSERLH